MNPGIKQKIGVFSDLTQSEFAHSEHETPQGISNPGQNEGAHCCSVR